MSIFNHWFTRTLGTAFMVLTLMFAGTAGMVKASAATAPGDGLYGLKRAVEMVQLWFAVGETRIAILNHLAETRLSEIHTLVDRGRPIDSAAINDTVASLETAIASQPSQAIREDLLHQASNTFDYAEVNGAITPDNAEVVLTSLHADHPSKDRAEAAAANAAASAAANSGHDDVANSGDDTTSGDPTVDAPAGGTAGITSVSGDPDAVPTTIPTKKPPVKPTGKGNGANPTPGAGNGNSNGGNGNPNGGNPNGGNGGNGGSGGNGGNGNPNGGNGGNGGNGSGNNNPPPAPPAKSSNDK